ncbi:MAG: prepilin-type N-terminal cleavage/methylation domain-containing protein [Candidatus Omnitrophota bacterium]
MNIVEEGRKKFQRIFFVLQRGVRGFTPTPIMAKKSSRYQLVRGFTIMELIVATVIVGVLVTLGFAQYSTYKERTHDSEAKANLRLIAAAEGIYRMEGNNQYYDSTWGGAGQPLEISNINTQLRLLLNNNAVTRIWDYKTTVNNTISPPKFCVQSQRNGADARTYKFVRPDDSEPVSGATCPNPPP